MPQTNIITTETALSNPNWEIVFTQYQDEDYTVFREVGIKEKETLWLHIHESGYTGIFINEHQYLRTVNYWEQLEVVLSVLRDPIEIEN